MKNGQLQSWTLGMVATFKENLVNVKGVLASLLSY